MFCQNYYKKDTMNYLNRFDEILDTMIHGMTTAPLTDSISHNFIVQMIPHHQAAIEMSQNILMYTDLKPLRQIAEHIISEQTKSIRDMRMALPACSELLNDRKDICLYQWHFTRITGTMFSDMRNACADNNISGDFMREMIPHHLGAIHMSENALHFNICPQLHPILQAIITSQENGIKEMEDLLHCV